VVAILVAAGLVFRGWVLLRDVLGKAPAWTCGSCPSGIVLYLLAAPARPSWRVGQECSPRGWSTVPSPTTIPETDAADEVAVDEVAVDEAPRAVRATSGRGPVSRGDRRTLAVRHRRFRSRTDARLPALLGEYNYTGYEV
jgi:hypothetical protein